MNGYYTDRELPALDDDQIYLIDSICKVASRSTEAPFRALTREYEAHFKEHGLDSSRDNAIFRWIMRIGEGARRAYRLNTPVNYVPYLRSLLESQGITVIDEDQEGEIEGVTRSLEIQPSSVRHDPDSERKRRSSFDDARIEETWLSERSPFPGNSPNSIAQDFLRQPPRRSGMFALEQRPRSVSGSERLLGGPHPAPKHFQHPSHSSDYTSDYEDQRNPTLLLEPSRTQLEYNAETFRDTTLMRHQRQCLHVLHETFIARQRDHAIASAHDRRQLLRPPWVCFVQIFQSSRLEREQRQREEEQIIYLDQILARFQSHKTALFFHRVFSHWHNSVLYNRKATKKVKEEILGRKYFRRWRDLATENIIKARSILSRKFLRVWQLKAARKSLDEEMRIAQYEEKLMRKYLKRWRVNCRSVRVEPWQEVAVERRLFTSLRVVLQKRREREVQATQYRVGRLTHDAFQKLRRNVQVRQQAAQTALEHHGRKAASQCVRILSVEAKLRPLATSFTVRLERDLKRKALNAWTLHLQLIQQAAEVDRKRILQSAWTTWNDRLRCKALSQRIDERVLLESLSRWLHETRLRQFRRTQNGKSLQRTIAIWRAKAQQTTLTLDEAASAFAESQRRRRLKYGLLRLHVTVRNREDAERTAVEFSNSRVLPDVIDVWRNRTNHVRQISKWAADARFYYLCTRSLKTWQERTTEHQHQRRRQAYAHVRARVKIRIVRDSFARLRARCDQLSCAKRVAEDRYQLRLFRVAIDAFDTWRQKTTQHIELDLRAQRLDQQKLLTSALSALINQHADIIALEQQALLLRQDVDLSLQASVLRKVQWAAFTSTRRVESADALWARNRDLHMKQMLRHWALQAVARKSEKSQSKQQDPDSPSLRPASRVASRSAQRPAFGSSPPIASATPGYLRTPSRSRRAGRFRPLPTPAHVTPMAFDKSYFVTTPAPLAGPAAVGSDEHGDVFDGLTPQITPFARKLRAGGVPAAPPSALRSSVFGRSLAGGTNKSVRFAGSSRFGSGQRRLTPNNE